MGTSRAMCAKGQFCLYCDIFFFRLKQIVEGLSFAAELFGFVGNDVL